MLKSRWLAWAETEAGGDAEKMARLMAKNTAARRTSVPRASFWQGDRYLYRHQSRSGCRHEGRGCPSADGLDVARFPALVRIRPGRSRNIRSGCRRGAEPWQAATRGGVLGVYQRSGRWPEQVKAMDMWGRMLTAAIKGKEQDANVVQINRTPMNSMRDRETHPDWSIIAIGNLIAHCYRADTLGLWGVCVILGKVPRLAGPARDAGLLRNRATTPAMSDHPQLARRGQDRIGRPKLGTSRL